MKTENYSILVGKHAAVIVEKVVRQGEQLNENASFPIKVYPLSEIDRINVPFITYGFPKEVKNFLKKHKKEVCSKLKKSSFPFVVSVQLPIAGGIMDVWWKKDYKIKRGFNDSKSWWKQGMVYMTIEESLTYRDNFLSGHFICSELDGRITEDMLKKLATIGIRE